MSLYDTWIQQAFTKDFQSIESVWNEYRDKEQKVYEYILDKKINKIEGTILEISKEFNMTPEQTVAFVDGINRALPTQYDVNSLTENSCVVLNINYSKLFKLMVEYKAENLYTLPQWNDIFDEETIQLLNPKQTNISSTFQYDKCDRITQPSNIPKCPTCGSPNLKKISATSKAVNTIAFGLLGTKRHKTFHCNNCGYEW